MSSKSSILYISQTDEHWYFEHVHPRDSVVLEVSRASVLEGEATGDWLHIVLRPEAPLARLLDHPAVRQALEQASKELGYQSASDGDALLRRLRNGT